jgi:Arc/MetJ family transcription regulator
MRIHASEGCLGHLGLRMKSKTTLHIDDDLFTKAQVLTGLDTKAAVVRAALEKMIANESAKRLVGGVALVKQVRHRRPRLPG